MALDHLSKPLLVQRGDWGPGHKNEGNTLDKKDKKLFPLEWGRSQGLKPGLVREATNPARLAAAPAHGTAVKIWRLARAPCLTSVCRAKREAEVAEDMKQGKWSFYNVFEKKIREQNFVDNVQDGPFTEYYDNGTKHFEGSFKGRLRDGKWSCWKPNGDLYYSVIFSNGKKVKELYVNDPSATKPF